MDSTEKQIDQIALIKAHYIQRFGKPTREAEFVARTGECIEVWKWSEAASREGVCIYATIGASTELDAGARRCEFFFGVSPEVDGVVESLAEIALHGTGTKFAPHFGDTVTLTWGLWPGTSMSTFLVTAGGDEIIGSLKTVDNLNVEFLQLVPLFADECAFKKANGEDKLWKHFEENQVPYWDSKRTSSIKSW